ncbi:MAG TPA: Crp/Fnr family transcriptional regulator [Sulfurihydrogenibium sp.]|jgi:CRP/FNR family transcriptional regulator|uniref:cyclic nucleotide-binding domain-containing protein n=1 Tax=Sulfurihydrogenibium sp. (strain YO3AOP1) TaxID=436114 RepID=UPI00017259A5|nr:Crp/Fnr family transcriptional regulator [Sulfurihydrogenibium sp. YO3AOP1]ACD66106.1 transcriptional regulator, Crp/Fnr family [Sulfurihydrogenibium sp. YO3AOP1]HBT98413.1 Crp/Fnr family transcriptional regulator [Sulfurihydrogenibium sp.]
MNIEDLKNAYLFSQLSEETLRKLASISRVKEYEPGQVLFFEGEKAENLYILLEGKLKVYKTTFKGIEVFINQFGPVTLIGEMANFEKVPYPATAEFITEGKVLIINFRTFEEEFLKNPEILVSIIKSLSNKIRMLNKFIDSTVVLSADARVAKLILESPEIFEVLKHNQIASFLNITPETLSRVISRLKQKGIIFIDGRKIIIKDRDKLKKISKDEPLLLNNT